MTNKLVNVEEIKLYHLHDTLFFHDERKNEWTFLRRNDFPGEEAWRVFVQVLQKQGFRCPRSLLRSIRH